MPSSHSMFVLRFRYDRPHSITITAICIPLSWRAVKLCLTDYAAFKAFIDNEISKQTPREGGADDLSYIRTITPAIPLAQVFCEQGSM